MLFFQFRRPVDEVLEKTISRMICSISQGKKKKKSLAAKLQNIDEKDDLLTTPVIVVLDSSQQKVGNTIIRYIKAI